MFYLLGGKYFLYAEQYFSFGINCHWYIIITMYIDILKEGHPNPGKPYGGIARQARLPYNGEGEMICRMLKVAFKRKLVFTIGHSRTTGRDGVITWNDITHKTDMPYGSQLRDYGAFNNIIL